MYEGISLMTDVTAVLLPGSERAALPDAEPIGTVPAEDIVTFTMVLRRKADLPTALVEGPDTVTIEEFAQQYGADPDDITLVTDILGAAGATITSQHVSSRRIQCSAPASVVETLFGTTLSWVRSPSPITDELVVHRARSGTLHLPAALAGIVTAVVGLDNRPQIRPYIQTVAPDSVPTSYTPPQLATVYAFPAADGAGQTVAILEFGGGYNPDDLNTYFRNLGLTPPPITAVSVDGAKNSPGDQADAEVALDIEVVGAVVPKAAQLVYFAPNTDQGFVDACSQSVHATPTPTAVSISWGGSEDMWSDQTRKAVDQVFADAAALGVTICVSSGDDGSRGAQTDGVPHADFPASSPHALAVGGTHLEADPDTGEISVENVWNGGPGATTGGGISDVFGVPSWQAAVGVPLRATKDPTPSTSAPKPVGAPIQAQATAAATAGRGVPDVAADADSATGYKIRVYGQDTVVGGTSAAAPLWAALVVRYSQILGVKLGLLQPVLYDGVTAGHAAPGLRDITSGNNGAYTAGPGWDPCTGLGVPIGPDLLERFRSHHAG